MLHATQWLLLLLGLLLYRPACAQNLSKDFQLKGVVQDSASNKPLDLITINLLAEKDVHVKAEYTRQNGEFSISGIKSGRYTLVIVGVGFQTKRIQADLTDTTKRTLDLGKIQLIQQTVGLKEITVSATKQVVKQEVDRITYDLQADPESKVFSVLDMMRKIPHLSLDADNNIMLKGSTDFRILINGKPSSMVERNYKEVLRTIPASTIERIEVITTPPAKYDAEGLAGIINIITNKKVDNGYNGSVNVSERFPVGGPSVGGSLSAKMGKWGLTAMGGANIYNTPSAPNMITRNTIGDRPTNLQQSGSGLSNSYGGYLGLEVSYEVDSLKLFSGQVNLNGNRSDGLSDQRSLLMEGQSVLQKYVLNNNNNAKGNGMDAALNYQIGSKKDKNRILTFSYRFYKFDNDQKTRLAITDRIKYDIPDYKQRNDQGFSEQTFQADYVYPMKKVTVEAGLKAILRKNTSDFQHYSWNEQSGDYLVTPEMSNVFSNHQNVFGAYNTYQFSLKSWGFKVGARLENTVMNADFVSAEAVVKQNYFNLIPSASISKKFKKNNSGLNFGYTQRIQRPGIYKLNPFVDRSNPNFERTGNPNLRNELANDFQLSYNNAKKGSINVGVGATFFKDLIFQVSTFDAETNINRISQGNTGSARLLMGNLNVNYPITKRWSYNMNARVAHGKVTGIVNEVTITNKGLMTQIYAGTSYRFDKGWRTNASLNFYGRGVNLQGRTNMSSFTSFSVSKDLMKDQISLSASLNNPFRKFRTDRRTTNGPDFMQTNTRSDYFRSFNISANYKFGKLKEGIKKNKRGIRNDDIQNGN